MKKILLYITLALSVFTTSSCLNDKPLIDWEDAIFVVELPYKTHYQLISKVKPEKNESINLMVNYAVPYASDNDKDLPVTLGIDEKRVDIYNSGLSSSTQKYILMPADAYTIPQDIVITKGTKLWKQPFEINTSKLEKGKKYLIPIVIKGVPEGYTISGNFGHLYVRIDMDK